MTEPEMTPTPADIDSLYRERAHLVAFLALLHPAVLLWSDPDDDWPVLYVNTSQGQMSWHIKPTDLDLFDHVPRLVLAPGASLQKSEHSEPWMRWDGHSTEEKYRRLRKLVTVASVGSVRRRKIGDQDGQLPTVSGSG